MAMTKVSHHQMDWIIVRHKSFRLQDLMPSRRSKLIRKKPLGRQPPRA